MVNRAFTTFSGFSLAIVAFGALLAYRAFAAVIGDGEPARIITAIVIAFALGALTMLAAVYTSTQLFPAGERRERPPYKTVVSRPPIGQQQTIAKDAEIKPIVFVQNGIPRILENRAIKRNASIIEWAELDAKTGLHVVRSIDILTLRRFARLHTPCRAEWSGKATTYSEALAFFKNVRWVRATSKSGGVGWTDNYLRLQRRLQYLDDPALTPESTQSIQIPA